ncbi:MAG TPA: hypothetical protein PLL78_13585 [Fimbriimonadaceae bacterium]|nr:hypothetical protein [Fimbriimonadaceae bacterium]HRJ97707.1 hypothetical protein [Fimbriimonadaceae bacterium]
MTEASEETRHVRSAEDLLLALRDPDLEVRVALLSSIMANPQVALQFGKFQNVDLIDELIAQTFRVESTLYRHIVTAVLSAFDDPRVPPHFLRLITYYGEPDLLEVVRSRLMLEPVEPGLATYRSLVLQTDSLRHTHAAADLLSRSESLEPRLALRVSVANTLEVDQSPQIDSETVSAWIAELNGPFLREASILAEGKGQHGFVTLAARANELDRDAMIWLLRWGARTWPLDAVEVVRLGLRHEDEEVVLEALRSVETLGPSGSLFAAEAAPLAQSSSARVRALAISVGAPLDSPRQALANETEPEALAELLARLRKSEGKAAIDILVDHLGHSHYRVRIQAQTELAALGEAAQETAMRLVREGNEVQRAAGANLLLGLGKQEWLEENLLG